MPAHPDSILIGTHVERGLAERFKIWARAKDGSVSAALRRILLEAVDEQEPQAALVTDGFRVSVGLKDAEKLALLAAARARQTSPSAWLRCLAVVHLSRRPQWNDQEVAELRAVVMELRKIGTDLSQIVRGQNVAAQSSEYPAKQVEAAMKAADFVRSETNRVVAIMTGNFDYWGLPDADRPTDRHGAMADNQNASEAERRESKFVSRRRPSRFANADS